MALLVTLALSASLSPSLDSGPAQAQAATLWMPSSVSVDGLDSDGDGAIDRPDASSAWVTAQSAGERVEDLSRRTPTTQVFANADGTWTTEATAGPVRAQDPATGEWDSIDTALVLSDETSLQSTESWHPKSAVGGMTFSNGGSGPMVTMTGEDADDLTWSWPDTLPAPGVVGNTLTYADVVPHGDLVVEALAGGFSYSVVLREAPTADVKLPILIDSGEARLTKSPKDGSLLISGDDGEIVSASEPLMWDHAEASDRGDTRSIATKVTTTDDGHRLVLMPDMDFLSDPNTEYPVTIDPTFSVSEASFVNYIGPFYERDGQMDYSILIGQVETYSFYRSVLGFDVTELQAGGVTSATLSLYADYSRSCTPSSVTVQRAISAEGAEWNTQPQFQPVGTTAGQATVSQTAKGGPSGCSTPGWDSWDITSIAQAWGNNGATNFGLILTSDDGVFREYVAPGNGTLSPKISVTASGDLPPIDADSDGMSGPYTALQNPVTINTTATAIPANSSRTVQVSGVGSLPAADDLSSVVSRLILSGWSASSGEVHLDNPAAPGLDPQTPVSWNTSNSSANGRTGVVVAPVSADGKIQIVNNSAGPVRVSAEVLAWYGPVDVNSYLPPNPATPLGSGDIVVQGKVQGASTGSSVIIEAWPDNEALGALAEGANVPVLPLANVPVTSNGDYSTTITASALPASYVGEQGQVDLDVTAYNGSGFSNFAVTAGRVPGASGSVPSVGVDFNLASSTAIDKGRPAPSGWTSTASQSLTEAQATAASSVSTESNSFIDTSGISHQIFSAAGDVFASPTGTGTCTPKKTATTKRGVEWFGPINTDTNALGTAYASYKTQKASTHTLGMVVGVKKAGAGGSFAYETKGTTTLSVGGEATQGPWVDKVVGNEVVCRLYDYMCGTLQIRQRWEAERISDLAGRVKSNWTYLGYNGDCKKETRKWSFTKTQGKQATVSDGLALDLDAGVAGIDISTTVQSGWDEGSAVHYEATGPTLACGSTSLGYVYSPEMEIKNR